MAEQLFQIGVKALVQNVEGAILLVGHHQKDGAIMHYDMPGGRMDAGETFADTLQRELREELDIASFEQGDLFDVVQSEISIPVAGGRVPLVLVVYLVSLPADAILCPGGGEEVFDWVLPQHAEELLAFKYPQPFIKRLVADL